ncbi:E3 ubiquitin-protein ligase RNF14-like [Trifolium pratense]|uniref:E3 ubiquitin-protein ligase RNF14-like n=1 Tax=Trifolium pratense TaxID=57577 RepID=UPI001E692079|nr:E3 ubiquitin-protein ligase RNF14-like [Trifolium pratense]
MDLETLHLPRKSNAVPQSTPEIIDVDTYRLSVKRAISDVINLSDEEDDDDIKILNFIPKTIPFGKRKRFENGESSNSRAAAFVCEICTDTKTIKDAFFISGCSHAYCSDCVSMYISSKLDDNITNIGCPVPGCNGLLEAEFCRSILKPEVFERWGKALCEALIDVSEKFYCPLIFRLLTVVKKILMNEGVGCIVKCRLSKCNLV